MDLNYLEEKLKTFAVRNCNLIGFIEDYPISRCEEFGGSFLVQGFSDRKWTYFSCVDKEEFLHLVDLLKEDDEYFAVLEDWMLDEMKQKFNIEVELATMKLVFPDHLPLPVITKELIPLSPDDADFIYENYNYKKFTTPEYIRERIVKGPGGGIFVNDSLVAWLLTHDDGAIGLLHVLDEYRRSGFAKELTYYLIQKVRDKGKIPFVHIEESNFKSLNLAKKIGFEECYRVHWAKRITGLE